MTCNACDVMMPGMFWFGWILQVLQQINPKNNDPATARLQLQNICHQGQSPDC